MEPAPTASIKPAKVISQRASAALPPETLAKPWFRAQPVIDKRAPDTPPPKPAPEPPPSDKTSVQFVGSFKDQSGTPTYFFKYAPTNRMLILKQGEETDGWTLKSVGTDTFTLLAAGGYYEVAR
jgi:hypothetical protein